LRFKLLIEKRALKYLSTLPEKSRRIIKERCSTLAENPFPGCDGDKELLHFDYKLYRLHVGRSFTVFYQISEEEKVVKILKIVHIDDAHKTLQAHVACMSPRT